MTNQLTERNAHLDAEVRAAAKQRLTDGARVPLPLLSSYVLPRLHDEIRLCLEHLGLDPELVAIGPPTAKVHTGDRIDIAFNLARASVARSRNPSDAAAEVAQAVSTLPLVASCRATGPYVNVTLATREFIDAVVDEILDSNHYGQHRTAVPRFVVLDYSHPNIAKNMTVAHLRSTIIGHALYKLTAAVGNVPFSVNHLGDWGTQFGKLLHAYSRAARDDAEGLAAALDADPTGTLMELYRGFVAREKDDPEALDEARELFLRLENGDAQLLSLWTQFRDWSMRDFDDVYAQLRVTFDAFQGESFYEDKMADPVADGLRQGVLRQRADGAVVFPSQPLFDPMLGEWNVTAMLDRDGGPRDEIVVKPSGGTVYLTRDLAAIRYRTKVLGADKLLYVIGKEQRLHCLVLFAMAEQMGYISRGQALHTGFGHLNFRGKKMKSREGTVVLLGDLIADATAAAAEIGEARNSAAELSAAEREAVARQVGIGALTFNDLRHDRQSDIEFDPDVAATLEAGQGGYVQYAYCRLRSVSARFAAASTAPGLHDVLPIDLEVVRHLARFPEVIALAAERSAPHRVATYLTELAQLTNVFYVERSVKDADDAERAHLLRIVAAATRVFEYGAHLLHLELPERM